MTTFTDIESALEEAEYCAQTEGRHYVLLAKGEGVIEVVPENQKGHRKVLEVIRVPAKNPQWNERRSLT